MDASASGWVAWAASGWNWRWPPRPKTSMTVFSSTDWFTGLMRKPSKPAPSACFMTSSRP